jgi:hypothetical protein
MDDGQPTRPEGTRDRLFVCHRSRCPLGASVVNFKKGEYNMSTYSPSELLSLWKKRELSLEQAVGYLLQNLLNLSQRLNEIEKRLCQLEEPPGKS